MDDTRGSRKPQAEVRAVGKVRAMTTAMRALRPSNPRPRTDQMSTGQTRAKRSGGRNYRVKALQLGAGTLFALVAVTGAHSGAGSAWGIDGMNSTFLQAERSIGQDFSSGKPELRMRALRDEMAEAVQRGEVDGAQAATFLDKLSHAMK